MLITKLESRREISGRLHFAFGISTGVVKVPRQSVIVLTTSVALLEAPDADTINFVARAALEEGAFTTRKTPRKHTHTPRTSKTNS